jgi:uncharacterized FlaG/YvyC family protein
MIEAVNSVVANVQVDRASAAQVDAARAYAANPDRVQEARQEVVQAPYVSPYIHVDVEYDKAVLQIRNPDTGDVLKQFPSETVLEARLRAEASRESQAARQPSDVREAPAQSDQPVSFRELSQTRSPEAEIASASLIAAAQTAQPNVSRVSVSA